MSKTVRIVEDIMSANDDLAQQNQTKLNQSRTLGINVMASPGSGKTSVILQTIAALRDHCQIGVVEGDTAAVTIDADKVLSAGMPAVHQALERVRLPHLAEEVRAFYYDISSIIESKIADIGLAA